MEKPEQNLTIANHYIAALSAGAGPDDLDTFVAPDFIQKEFPNRLLPNGATRDLQSMKHARARGKALLSAEHFEIVGALASGSHVAMEIVWTGTVGVAAGPFVAGQALRAQFAIFLEFRDGRIVRQHNYDCFDPW